MFLFFDTETTGTNRSKDHIVQIAWILAGEDCKEIARASHIIRPDGYSIPAASTAVHGITTARALREGKPLYQVLSEFAQAAADAKVVVAHNLSFDEAFIRRAYEDEYFAAYPLRGKKKICTMKETTAWCQLPKPSLKPGYKWPKLEELHVRVFRRTFDNPHEALADTQACMRCFFELLRRKVLEPPLGRASGTAQPNANYRESTSIARRPTGTRLEPKPTRSQQAGASDRKSIRLYLSRKEDRHYLAKSSKAEPEQLERLLGYDDVAALALAAKNPNATSALIQKFLCRLRQEDVYALLEDENLSAEALAALAVHRDIRTVHAVSKHPRCDAQVLHQVIERLMWGQADYESLVVTATALGLEAVLGEVLAHPETPDDFLDEWFWAWCSSGQWTSATVEAENPQAAKFTQNPNAAKNLLAELAWRVPYGGPLWHKLNGSSKINEADMEDALSELAEHGPAVPISTEYLYWEHTDPRLLSRLAQLQDRLVQYLIVRHPNSPSDIVYAISENASLARQGLHEYCLADFEHKYTDADGETKRENIEFEDILSAALAHPAHPVHLLRSAKCSASLLKQYKDSPLPEVREIIAKHKRSPSQLLASLARDPEIEVRKLLVQNPNCPVEALLKLLHDEEPTIRVTAAKIFAHRKGTVNRRVQEAIARNSCYEVREQFVSLPSPDRDLLFRLTTDSNKRVRMSLATSPKVDADLLERFADDPCWEVRRQILKRTDCPASFVYRVANDPSTTWRLAAASSAGGPPELFELLASDADAEIRLAVMNNASCPLGIRSRLFEAVEKNRDGAASKP
jgi:DNA polymerase III epsilon subunit-like protein